MLNVTVSSVVTGLPSSCTSTINVIVLPGSAEPGECITTSDNSAVAPNGINTQIYSNTMKLISSFFSFFKNFISLSVRWEVSTSINIMRLMVAETRDTTEFQALMIAYCFGDVKGKMHSCATSGRIFDTLFWEPGEALKRAWSKFNEVPRSALAIPVSVGERFHKIRA